MNGEGRLTRIEDDYRELLGRVSANEKLLAALPYMTDDIAEIRADCKKTREWVEEKIKEQQKQEDKEKTLSATQKAAVTGGIFLLLVSLVNLIGTFAGAGP